jgi:hypothetical protein
MRFAAQGGAMSYYARALIMAALAAIVMMMSPAKWLAGVTAATITAASPAQEQAPPAAAAAQDPAASTQAEADGVTTAALLAYSGGVAKAKRARTETVAVSIGSPLFWRPLPNATLSYSIPFLTSDLLNVSFSAECSKFGGGQARIRVLDNGIAMQPYDGAQVFCSALSPATYTGTWTRRAPAGAHTIVVQFMNTAGTVVIDDWTFELVVYD